MTTNPTPKSAQRAARPSLSALAALSLLVPAAVTRPEGAAPAAVTEVRVPQDMELDSLAGWAAAQRAAAER